MKKYFYMAVAAIAVLSSCDKANNIIDGGQENTVNAPVFTATINPGTKTTIAQNPETGNYTKVNWESGDEVAMIFFNQSGHVYSFPTYVATPSVADASTATLSIKAGETYNPEANQLADVLYPSSVLDRETNMLYFPATQVYKGDNKIGFAPMVFLNFSLHDKEHVIPVPENIQMQNACALLQITVPYSEMHEVRSIIVSSDLQMNGAFSIDSDDDGMFIFDNPSNPDDGENQITLDCYSYTKSNVTIPEGGSKTFYISIVARESTEAAPYFKYLNIDVTDGITTKTMRTKTFAGTKGDGIEIKPNVIYPFTFKHNQTPTHAYVDLGLSVKWATVNVGATTLEGYGDYFAWGATTGHKAGYEFSWENYKWMTDGESDWEHINKYTIADYNKEAIWYSGDRFVGDGKTSLDPEDDAATANWGGNWRMPTTQEWDELLDPENCTWTSATIGGVDGFKVQSKKEGYTDNWIFIPAAGGIEEDGVNYSENDECQYWSNNLDPDYSDCADILFYNNTIPLPNKDSYDRNYGLSVRPVYSDVQNSGITGVSLNKTSTLITAGANETLTATVSKNAGAVNTRVEWSSSNTTVATVDYTGKVIAVSAGTATITARTVFGGFSATCDVTVTTPVYEYVDLGLSVKWATFNVGATAPEEYGDYFAWGATAPLYETGYAQENPQAHWKPGNHWKPGRSYGYCWNNTPYQTADAPDDDSPTTWTKYLADAEKTVLDLTDDAARANWGGSWRMPTNDEWKELLENCTCTWTTTLNGVNGYKVQSNKTGYTDNWIFLPAAGYRGLMDPDDFTDLVAARSEGYYWSSSLRTEDPSNAWYFCFDSGGHITDADSRYYGHPVRPVCE